MATLSTAAAVLLVALHKDVGAALAMGKSDDFRADYIGPKQTIRQDVRASVLGYGSATARYICVCDEVGESEGVIEFEVRKRRYDRKLWIGDFLKSVVYLPSE
jgi:hypothetical protein